MMRSNVATPCRLCGKPVPDGYQWHRPCLLRYRASVPYRQRTLVRDGYNCARCFDWHNRLVNDAYAWRWQHTPDLLRPHVHEHRRVEADHVDPLALTGTHDPKNLQVLCMRHHRAKTRVDLAHMKGTRPPRRRARALLITLLVLVAAWLLLSVQPGQYQTWGPAGALAAALTLALLARARMHRRTLRRLHAAIAEVTQVAVTDASARRHVRARRWHWTRIDGLRLPRPRPSELIIKYPGTFRDHDPAAQANVESRVEAKLGGSWTAKWNTQADQLVMRSPDPLVSRGGVPWPWLNVAGCNLWDPVPVGVNEAGDVVTVRLPGKNLLIGGEPEAGKSVSQSMLIAAAALDPRVVIHGIDGKNLVELGLWRDSLEDLVASPADAVDLLKDLQELMDLRYSMMFQNGRRKIEREDGDELHLLVIDELARFTAAGSKAETAAFTEALRDVISRGRAAGVITVAATQRPSADVVPTMIRDLIGYRWALRCSTPQSSDMVLGAGWATQGANAARVPSEFRGVGWLLAEGRVPVRLRSFLLTDADVASLAARAASARSAAVVGPLVGQPEV